MVGGETCKITERTNSQLKGEKCQIRINGAPGNAKK